MNFEKGVTNVMMMCLTLDMALICLIPVAVRNKLVSLNTTQVTEMKTKHSDGVVSTSMLYIVGRFRRPVS